LSEIERHHPNVGGIFSPYLVTRQAGWKKNTHHMRDLIDYLNLEDYYYYFPIGNCFFLSMDMATELYGDDLIYQTLNTPNSLDLGWFVEYYGDSAKKTKLLDSMRREKIALNNLHLGSGHDGLADSMIEHAFERIVFLVLRRHKRIGIFDLATKPLSFQWKLRQNNDSTVLERRSLNREPVDNRDLVQRYFARNSKYERIAVVLLSLDSSTLQNIDRILSRVSELAYDIVVVSKIRDWTNQIENRESFVIDDELTETQCRHYSNVYDHGYDLSALSNEDLQSHYRRHGLRARRFLTGVSGNIWTLVAKKPAQQYLTGLRFALQSHYQYSDYIVCNCQAIMRYNDLTRFVETFSRDIDVNSYGDIGSNFVLRRFNAVSAIKAFRRKKILGDLSIYKNVNVFQPGSS